MKKTKAGKREIRKERRGKDGKKAGGKRKQQKLGNKINEEKAAGESQKGKK